MELKQKDICDKVDFNSTTAMIPYNNIYKYKSKFIIKIEKILKRTIDIIGGLFGTVALIPLTLILFIANFISNDKGPVFYSQERIGINGKIFKMYKYRSMVVGAEDKLTKYLDENENAKKEYEVYKKIKKDPRVTLVGEFIRRTSLDEFPQFINVLKGEMSLVGPRPYLKGEKEEMIYFYKYITSFKPGITGYWQINGRNDVTFKDRLKMDMEYYRDNSFVTDIKILLATVKKVIKMDGAI